MFRTIIAFLLIGFSAIDYAAGENTSLNDNWLSLAGQWRFALDFNNAGITEKWFQKSLDDQINLPGTTDENHKGRLNNARETIHLTRLYPFAGNTG